MTQSTLRRVRWAVRAILLLGVAASVTANVLHANPNPISQGIAAWPPLALLLTVELISRVPVHRRSLAISRWVATAIIASIAAWVSYWHMAGVAARYGEVGASPYLVPFTVDGLIVVASVCLVELGGRIREAAQPAAAEPHEPLGTAASAIAPAAPVAAADPAATPEGVQRRSGARSSAERVVRAARRTPEASPATLAARLGLSERTVQRHLRDAAPAVDTVTTADPASERVNGAEPAHTAPV